MARVDVPDLNVWLALADPDHVHHPRAREYWKRESLVEIAFCRITTLGLLRLLTNSKVMRGEPFSPCEAWAAYRAFATLPEISFLEESLVAEEAFTRWTDRLGFPVHRWTDAWIAAIAFSAQARAVSFDADFGTFTGLRFLHLKR